MTNSFKHKSFKSELISTVQSMLNEIDFDSSKSFLKNNYSNTDVSMTIKFLNGDYSQNEELLFLEIFEI